MATKRETNCSHAELCRMMKELRVDHKVNAETLKLSYYNEIKLHHTDKGGSSEKTKNLTRAYRILRTYLEENILLPDFSRFNLTDDDEGNAWSNRGPSRPSYQPQQQASNPYGDEENEEFYSFIRRRRKRDKQVKGFSRSSSSGANIGREFGESSGNSFYAKKDFRRAGRFRGFEEAQPRHDNYFWDDEDDEQAHKSPLLDVSKKTFANNYKYTNDDLSNYSDPYEKDGRATEHCRVIRGGLVLMKDFGSSNAASEFADYEFTQNSDDIEFYTNPKFEPVIDRLQKDEESLFNFTEKMKILVNLDWAMSKEFQTDAKIRGVRLSKMSDDESEDDTLYKFTVPMSCLDELLNFSAGIHVEVCSTIDENMVASAVIDSFCENTVVLFFLEPNRIIAVLSNSPLVDIRVNASAFVFRSMLRSIEYVQQRKMDSIIYPKFNFSSTFEEYERYRDSEIRDMGFLDGDGFNDFQKSAVYSIVLKANRPYPFLLFGPPGTGKTVTLIEAIRQLIIQSPNNRILVCTPSRMAADNFAETLLDKKFIDPKYVFRMHSMSTSAIGRNRKLDPISYMPKEGRGRFYGIPNRLNLRLFRVIISTLSTSSYLISAGGLRGHFTHIIIDEAGQATEADTWIPIGGLVDPKSTSLILAGDPRQLGPVVNITFLKSYGYGLSMLKRLIYSVAYKSSDDRTMVVLKKTYRSHFRILRPCSYLFYNNMLVANEEDEVLYKLCEWSGLPTKGFPIVFHSSSGSVEESSPNKSYSNTIEAKLVQYYVERLLKETDVKAADIGIISPYKNQVLKLRTMLVKYPKLTIDSVEGFQGSEREVIIISTVRTRKIGFLQCDLRLNTSISRVKSLLVVIGDDNLLRVHISWQKFIYYCRYHGGYLNNSGEKELVRV